MKNSLCILMVSSSGGHLVQMSRLYEKLSFNNCVLMSTAPSEQIPANMRKFAYHQLPEANQRTPFKVLLVCKVLYKKLKVVKPDVVISTGAAPGAICIVLAKLVFRSKCVWIDSLANTKKMSLSGLLVRRFCDLWISQWEDVASSSGALYMGKVI